jgi:hypothetical protein
MPLRAYEDFAAEPLAFPIGNRVYTAPPVGLAEGIKLEQILSGKVNVDDEPQEFMWRLVLGSAWDEMQADNVPAEAAARAGLAAVQDFQFGREAAEAAWEAGIDPKALAKFILSREASEGSPQSSSTGSESATPSQVSTKRTTSRKKSTRPKAAPQSAS